MPTINRPIKDHRQHCTLEKRVVEKKESTMSTDVDEVQIEPINKVEEPMPVYEPSFISSNHLRGVIELNGVDVLEESDVDSADDDEGIEFEAVAFEEQKVKVKLQDRPIEKIELWDLHCSGETFAELMQLFSKHMVSGEDRSCSLRDFRFMSDQPLKGVTWDQLRQFAEKSESLESLVVSATKNCDEETRDILTDFLTKIIRQSSKLKEIQLPAFSEKA